MTTKYTDADLAKAYTLATSQSHAAIVYRMGLILADDAGREEATACVNADKWSDWPLPAKIAGVHHVTYGRIVAYVLNATAKRNERAKRNRVPVETFVIRGRRMS